MKIDSFDITHDNSSANNKIVLNDAKNLLEIGILEDRHILYSPVLRRAYISDEEAYNLIISRNYSIEQDNNILEHDLLTDAPTQPIIDEHYHSIPNSLTLYMTHDCNLRCIYCHSNGGIKSDCIDVDMAKKAIDLIISKTRCKELKIRFTGGEPTLYIDKIKELVEYASAKTNLKSSIITNGTFSEPVGIWLADNMDQIILSCDGSPDIQNAQRPFRNGCPSNKHLENTMNVLKDIIEKVEVRSTFTDATFNRQRDAVEYFHDFDIRKLYFEPIFLVGRALSNSLKPVNYDEFSNYFLKAMQLSEQYGMILATSLLPIDKPRYRHCGASDPMFNLTIDGSITSCTRVLSSESFGAEQFIYGKYNSNTGEFEFNKNNINKLRALSHANNDACQNCIAKWNCGGGCPFESLLANASTSSPNKAICDAKINLLKSYILMQAENHIKHNA